MLRVRVVLTTQEADRREQVRLIAERHGGTLKNWKATADAFVAEIDGPDALGAELGGAPWVLGVEPVKVATKGGDVA